MANTIKLEVLVGKIREKHDVLNFKSLKSIDEHKSFYFHLSESLNLDSGELKTIENRKKSYRIDKNILMRNDPNYPNLIAGRIESGDYGYEEKIYNIETKTKTYDRKPEDTGIKPFYFLFYIPEDGEEFYLILQRFGVYGVKTIFKELLKELISRIDENLIIELANFYSQDQAIKFVEMGNIRQLKLIKYGLPPNLEDQLGVDSYNKEIKSLELSINPKRGFSLPFHDKLKNFIKNPNAKFFTIQDDSLGFNEAEKTRVEIELNGTKRIMDLSENMKIKSYLDIDDTVKKDESGHPVFQNIHELAVKYMNDLKREIS